jgi:PAS domain S-box-containing protein
MAAIPKSALTRYGGAIVAVAIASLATLALGHWLVPGPPTIFLAAVTATAWYGGVGAGLVAVVVAAATLDSFFLASSHFLLVPGRPLIPARPDALRLLVFVSVAVLVISLIAVVQRKDRAQRRVREDLQRLMEERSDALIEANVSLVGTVGALRRTIAERRQVEDALQESERRFRTAFADAAVGIAITTPEGRFLEVNRAYCTLTGYTEAELVGTDFFSITHPADIPANLRLHYEMRSGAVPSFVIEKRYVRKGGDLVWVQNSVSLVRDPQGKPLTIIVLVEDVTQRKRAETALRESEERFRTLVAGVTDYAIFMLDRDGCVMSWNAGAERIKGYPAGEILGQHFSCFYPPEERAGAGPMEALRAAEAAGRLEEEGWRVRRDGTRFLAHIVLTAVRDAAGGLRGFSKVTRDITERWHAEAERQRFLEGERLARAEAEASRERLRALSHRLVEVQEAERRHIARELHDEIGQLLTALSFSLSRSGPMPPAVATRLETARSMVTDLIGRVREMSVDLRPGMLDEFGLLPALDWHIKRFTERTGMKVVFRASGLEERRFPAPLEITVYRLVQEGLTNAVRHAGVTEAVVRVWADDTRLSVQVEDKGRGFDPDQMMAAPGSSGLLGMRERIAAAGGVLAIESSPGRGVLVSASMPLDAEVESDAEIGSDAEWDGDRASG